jgi:polar amino acid transport system permease protein
MSVRSSIMVPRGAPLPVLLPLRRPAPRSLTLPLDAAWQRRATLVILMLLAGWLLCAEALAQAGVARPGIAALLWKWTPVIFSGFLFNILISVLSMAIGTVAGVVLGLLQVSLVRPVRQSAWVVTQFFRNAPWLVILFYCILLIPFELTIFGATVPFPAWIKAVIGLSLPVMAYVSEFVRGAVSSIPSGQWEAAESLAFSRLQTMTMVILPQCVKRLLPPWMNLYAILTMATPLVSIVGVQEAMTLTRAALSSEGRFDLLIPMYLYILMWFFLYCYPISRYTVRLERRYGRAS